MLSITIKDGDYKIYYHQHIVIDKIVGISELKRSNLISPYGFYYEFLIDTVSKTYTIYLNSNNDILDEFKRFYDDIVSTLYDMSEGFPVKKRHVFDISKIKPKIETDQDILTNNIKPHLGDDSIE